ncbi:HTH-type transcriptional regulator LutR [Corynebacterium faecale]|nr:HTH-type transcriptional regulator LutR [Corynebacterium faecale]
MTDRNEARNITAPRRPARARSTTQEAVRGIKRYIRDQNLRPGDALPPETFLCEELGCSRSAIREAIRTLVTLDIVEVRHGYGTFISEMSLEPLINVMTFRAVLDADTSLENLRHVVETREMLDLSVGQELVETFSEDWRGELLALVDKMDANHKQGVPFAQESQNFHLTLLARIRNPLISELGEAFRRIQSESQALLDLPMPDDMNRAIEAHRDIVEALSARDPEAYRVAVRNHHAPFLRMIENRLG